MLSSSRVRLRQLTHGSFRHGSSILDHPTVRANSQLAKYLLDGPAGQTGPVVRLAKDDTVQTVTPEATVPIAAPAPSQHRSAPHGAALLCSISSSRTHPPSPSARLRCPLRHTARSPLAHPPVPDTHTHCRPPAPATRTAAPGTLTSPAVPWPTDRATRNRHLPTCYARRVFASLPAPRAPPPAAPAAPAARPL